MKISQIIEILEIIKKNNGDIEVYILDKEKKEVRKVDHLSLGAGEDSLIAFIN